MQATNKHVDPPLHSLKAVVLRAVRRNRPPNLESESRIDSHPPLPPSSLHSRLLEEHAYIRIAHSVREGGGVWKRKLMLITSKCTLFAADSRVAV